MRKMKKLFIALALAGASVAVAHAQSAVEIYGVADMGFVAESGAIPSAATKVTPVKKLTSGVGHASRFQRDRRSRRWHEGLFRSRDRDRR
jgi:GBP family porin